MEWKIRDIVIPNQLVLAPMAGNTNEAFRIICKEMGCGLVMAEMVSDKAIGFKNVKTIKMTKVNPIEHPISMQIFGADIESLVNAAKFIDLKSDADIIDINMGCPVPKVAVHAQAGSALLKNPEKIKEIVSAVVKAVPIPVTVKIRSGWDKEHINAVEVAKVCEEAGASAITVHPRTRSEGYSGKADWSIIKEVKKAVSIPVIGNGDIKSAEDAKKMIDETGCDAVMIGRATLGNPWLIREIVSYLEDGTIIDKPTPIERVDMVLKHIEYLREIKPLKVVVLEIRNHVSWYLKGLKNANEVKNKIFLTKDINDIINIIQDYRNSLMEE